MAEKGVLTKSWILVSMIAILLFSTVGLPLLMYGQGNFGNRFGGNRGSSLPPIIPHAIEEFVSIRQEDCWVSISAHVNEGDYDIARVICIFRSGTQLELMYNGRTGRYDGSICLDRGPYDYYLSVYTVDGLMWRMPGDGYWRFQAR
ncbi:MAG: hypothetical protein HXS41_04045 [Theionarchaea archaeon]|nr:hypothetical protein [Theionarchaea archaeon]MBU6999787.1 hypothetical protein [Theionarchaea archaeon]MBU7020208.1 hypothetical protein [Theionarchaea archaeon]MBU7033674.1 hypothetical protein [Theionarchaea archaeon]MBU7040493.1 hypothetical protein [Theionarchaea archaeon]